MRSILQPRSHSLICFSRRIGFSAESWASNQTSPIARGKPRHRSTFIVLTPLTDVPQRKSVNSSEQIVWDRSRIPYCCSKRRRRARDVPLASVQTSTEAGDSVIRFAIVCIPAGEKTPIARLIAPFGDWARHPSPAVGYGRTPRPRSSTAGGMVGRDAPRVSIARQPEAISLSRASPGSRSRARALGLAPSRRVLKHS